MEKNTNKQQGSQFENLKTLGGLLSTNELSSFVSAISKAKLALDNYCKILKSKEQSVAKKTETETSAPKEVYTPKSFERQNTPNAQAKPFERRQDSRPNNGFVPRQQGTRPSQGARPQGAGARPTQGATSRPTTGAPRPTAKPSLGKVEKITVITKPERSFGNKNKSKVIDSDKQGLNIKAKIRMGFVELDDYEAEERMGRVRTLKPKKAKQNTVVEKQEITEATITTDNLTVKILSEKLGKPATEIIKKFMMLGMMPNINSVIDFDTAELVAGEFGITLKRNVEKNYEEQLQEMFDSRDENLVRRPPIVTVMGHVDHGKTSLLDAIKKTNVVSGEAGGITQHIGAYSIEVNNRKITFIDTPGHEAFTAMRARGAKVTDIAILVVAADDGIMPQTVEAINHIKAAGVPMIVAINKMDKPTANPDRILQQLTEYDIVPEQWGGDAICVPISALTGMGIDQLLEMVLLVSDVSELSADPTQDASGFVIESKVDKGRGVVATVLVRDGTLKVGDYIVSGVASGRVRAMMDYKGNSVKTAEPSTAVSVLGFNVVPEAGDKAYVVDEKMAKNIVAERTAKMQIEKSNQGTNITLEDFLKQSADNEIKVLNIIIKADVKGSSEALKDTLEKIHNEEVRVKCIHASVGGINESDVLLAQASHAIIIGFNVRPDAKAKALAERNGVDVKLYRVIYEAVDDITLAINGMLAPKFEEVTLGHAEIRQTFKISSVGTIAGCYVLDGVVNRGAKVRLLRSNVVVAETEIETLQQQKDDAKTVKSGYECGIKLKNYNDIKIGDVIEAYEMKQI